jgi:hypothetical protein
MNERWLAALEALADPRIGSLPVAEVPQEALAAGLAAREGERAVLVASARDAVLATLVQRLRGRAVEWREGLTEGELFDHFARHCHEDLDDVEVLNAGPTRLSLRWRGGEGTVELRAGLLGASALAASGTALMLAPIDEALATRFLDDATVRGRLAVCDVAGLQKINAVRSSPCVYFEWYLREAFGARVLPAEAFTAGLVQRGILSLGMG